MEADGTPPGLCSDRAESPPPRLDRRGTGGGLALVCGVFWELWNWHAYPKWVYDTPGWDFWHVFEMPLFGYLGYLPFGLELYPLAHLLLPRAPDVRI